MAVRETAMESMAEVLTDATGVFPGACAEEWQFGACGCTTERDGVGACGVAHM